MIKLTIDGKTIEAPEGTSVLNAAQAAGIHIPTLCHFEALKPYGGCRLCVVEIEGFRTLQASCTLPVTPGMVVKTATPKVLAARKFILSMLFSERNHYCMYCQKTSGDCELQNAAYNEQMTHWPIQPNWNPYPVDASHPHFVIDHNRCILCRRCVRACGELVGNYTLSIENRGYSSLLIADYGIPIGESSCVRCGTCLQVCPTGAIIDRRSAYLGKNAETQRVESICVGCSVGCSIELVVRNNRVIRVDGNWTSPVNGGVLCEVGHFLEMDQNQPRVQTPLVRQNGVLEPASWDEALNFLIDHMKPLVGKDRHGVAALASTRLPVEALAAYKSIFSDYLGSSMVTTIEENATFAIQRQVKNGSISLNGSLDTLKNADVVVAVGVDLIKNHQVAGFFVKRNLPLGASLVVIDPSESQMMEIAHYPMQLRPGSDSLLLQGITAEIARQGLAKNEVNSSLVSTGLDLETVSQKTGVAAETIRKVSQVIAQAKRPAFIFGKGITNAQSPQALEALIALAEVVGAKEIISPKGKANSMAALRLGLDGVFEPEGRQLVYLALGDNLPENRLLEKIKDAPFLAVQASYHSAVTERANVVFPVVNWMEQSGHYINMEGRVQEACAAVQAPEGIWSNTQVFEAIAARLGYQPVHKWIEELHENL